MSIHSYLDLSTGHVKHETFAGWLPYTKTLMVATHEYGAIVSVPSQDWFDDTGPADIPEDLFTVLKYARAQGCNLVNFDQDGESIGDLPFYDW